MSVPDPIPKMTAEGYAATPTLRAMRTPRSAAIAGLVFSVLLASSFVLIHLAVPDHSETAGVWVTDASRRKAVLIGLNLVPFAGIAFLWFVGVMRDRFGAAEDRFFATVFLGSGLLFVAMVFTAGAVGGALVATATANTGSAVALGTVWSFGRRVWSTVATVYAMRMAAVFAIATTTIAARLGLMPRSLVVFGYATATALLFGSGFVPWLELLFPAWVFVLSVHILIVTFRQPPVAGSGQVARTGNHTN